jgi:hypothetical protein
MIQDDLAANYRQILEDAGYGPLTRWQRLIRWFKRSWRAPDLMRAYYRRDR